MRSSKTRKTVPALRRGLRLLEIVAAAESKIGFSELLAQVDIPRATAARLLQALREEDYVVRDDAGGYRLGPKMKHLLVAGTLKAAFRRHAGCLLQLLMETTGNTAAAFYWDGHQTEVVAKQMHPAAVVMQPVGNCGTPAPGCPWNLYFFQALTAAEREAFILAAKKKRVWARQKRMLAAAKENGFAFDDCTVLPGVRRLAAPVFADGQLVGCLALGGTPYTMPDNKVNVFGRLLRQRAEQLTQVLSEPT